MKQPALDHTYLKYELQATEATPFSGIVGWMKTHCANALENSEVLRKLARGILAISYVLLIGLFAMLAFFWVLGIRLFQLVNRVVYGPRQKRIIRADGIRILTRENC